MERKTVTGVYGLFAILNCSRSHYNGYEKPGKRFLNQWTVTEWMSTPQTYGRPGRRHVCSRIRNSNKVKSGMHSRCVSSHKGMHEHQSDTMTTHTVCSRPSVLHLAPRSCGLAFQPRPLSSSRLQTPRWAGRFDWRFPWSRSAHGRWSGNSCRATCPTPPGGPPPWWASPWTAPTPWQLNL